MFQKSNLAIQHLASFLTLALVQIAASAAITPISTVRYVEAKAPMQAWAFGPAGIYQSTGSFQDNITVNYGSAKEGEVGGTVSSSQQSSINLANGQISGSSTSTFNSNFPDSSLSKLLTDSNLILAFHLDQAYSYLVDADLSTTASIGGAELSLYRTAPDGKLIGNGLIWDYANQLINLSGTLPKGDYAVWFATAAGQPSNGTSMTGMGTFTFNLTAVEGPANSVPEPSTLALFGAAALAFNNRRWVLRLDPRLGA
jgi:PEP-CTERM motif